MNNKKQNIYIRKLIDTAIRVFPILVLKLDELDKYITDSGVYCLWIVFFTHIVKITVHV